MRFEIRYFFLEIGLSPKGLTQYQEKCIWFQTSLYNFTFHGLACVTIQCVRYYISVNILAKYQYFIFAHFWRGVGGPKILYWDRPAVCTCGTAVWYGIGSKSPMTKSPSDKIPQGKIYLWQNPLRQNPPNFMSPKNWEWQNHLWWNPTWQNPPW